MSFFLSIILIIFDPKIVNESGNVLVEYTYDAWGKVLNETSTSSSAYANIKDFNPFRYRGYIYDTDTGLYYLQSRYYDPQTGRFINADDTAYIGATRTVLSANLFAYCENEFNNNKDSTGHVIETIFDVASAIWSLVEFINEPSLTNGLFFVWDIVSIIIPCIPGSYVAKGGKIVIKVASKIDDFADGKKFLTGTYKGLRKIFKEKKALRYII